MKKFFRFFAAIIVVMTLSIGAFAQNTDNADVTASATVLTGIDVEKVLDLAFGSIAQGTTKTVALGGTVTGPTQQGTETVGKIKVTAQETSSIQYLLTTPTVLKKGTEELPVTFVAEYLTAATYATGTLAIQNVATDITMPAGNTLYYYIGGTIDAASNPEAGLYEGTLKLLVTYN